MIIADKLGQITRAANTEKPYNVRHGNRKEEIYLYKQRICYGGTTLVTEYQSK